MVMRYMVKCACDSSTSLGYTSNGVSYSWPGLLGVAPQWCAGNPIPEVEQQLVSACLAAHVNKYGMHVSLSVRGVLEDGVTQIPFDPSENTDYPVKEGCFFGNLFNGTGVYSAYDNGLDHAGTTSPRACVMYNGKPASCLPLAATGKQCSGICDQNPSVSNSGIWKSCLWGGVRYRAIVTRLRPVDVYSCGDGVCQFTETCYDAKTRTGCAADCGNCP
jgi:hypothetical protein